MVKVKCPLVIQGEVLNTETKKVVFWKPLFQGGRSIIFTYCWKSKIKTENRLSDLTVYGSLMAFRRTVPVKSRGKILIEIQKRMGGEVEAVSGGNSDKQLCWKWEQRNAVGGGEYGDYGRIILMEKIHLGAHLPVLRIHRNLLLKFFDPLFRLSIPKQFFPICHSSSDMDPTFPPFSNHWPCWFSLIPTIFSPLWSLPSVVHSHLICQALSSLLRTTGWVRFRIQNSHHLKILTTLWEKKTKHVKQYNYDKMWCVLKWNLGYSIMEGSWDWPEEAAVNSNFTEESSKTW